MATVLQLKDFTKSYDGQKPAVDHVSLEVEEGEIFGFIGHNGAGKSTTIKSIVGILSSHNGEIYIDGKTLWEAKKECQKKMAYIPDNPDLYEYMTGISYINFIADIYEVPTDVRTERIEKIADAFEIKEALGDLISSYSHGYEAKGSPDQCLCTPAQVMVLVNLLWAWIPSICVLKQEMRCLVCTGKCYLLFDPCVGSGRKVVYKVAMIDHGHIVVSGSVEELTREASLEEVFLEQLELAKAQVESHA